MFIIENDFVNKF